MNASMDFVVKKEFYARVKDENGESGRKVDGLRMERDMKIVFSVRVNLFDNNNDNDVDDGSGRRLESGSQNGKQKCLYISRHSYKISSLYFI